MVHLGDAINDGPRQGWHTIVCNLMLNIIESLNSQVAADLFVELDSLEEITRALLSATDATSWSPASLYLLL